MLTANELRLGNLIYDTKGQVNAVTLEALKYIQNESHHQCKPIELSEQWLLRLGLKQTASFFELGSEPNEFIFERYDSTQAKIWWRDRYLGICQRLEFVHQFQNFVFTLTGKELTIKP